MKDFMKDFKMILSVGLAYLLWPFMAIELSLTIIRDTVAGIIPEKSARDGYVSEKLMNCKVLRFCFRMFFSTVETDEIIREHSERRNKRSS